MRTLYKFHWDWYRMGELTGLFIAESEDVDAIIGKEIYFGEVLGKHSEVEGVIERDHITVMSEDQEFIAKYIEVLGDEGFGINPLDFDEDNE